MTKSSQTNLFGAPTRTKLYDTLWGSNMRYSCGCRKPRPGHATRRYSLIRPPTRACLVTRYCSRSTGSGSGFRGRRRPGSGAAGAGCGGSRTGAGPVRAENPVHGSDQQSCSPSRPAAMITDHVPAVRVPPDHAGYRMAAAVPARGGVEDRRDLDPAPPARRPATAAAMPPEPDLGGPRTLRDPAQRDTQSAAPRAAAAGHPRHDPALAPRHRPPPLGRQVQARQDRPASDPPEHQGPGPPAGPGEPRMGLPQDPRRTGRPGSDR